VSTGKLKRTFAFDLGRHWDNGDAISPRPVAIPKQSKMAVFNYYPAFRSAVLDWLGRTCRLNAFGCNNMVLLDANDGTRQSLELHEEQIIANTCFSPDGNRLAIGYMDGNVVIWDLSPRRSYTAPFYAAIFVFAPVLLLWAFFRRRNSSSRV
jgi:WD40 repeat protein